MPSSGTHGSSTSSCCIGDSCGLKSSVSPSEIARKCRLAAVLSALLQLCALYLTPAASHHLHHLAAAGEPEATAGVELDHVDAVGVDHVRVALRAPLVLARADRRGPARSLA